MVVETIRFYQRKGLLQTPPRGSGIRRYGSEDLRRLRFIRQAQAASFTLKEIKELLDLDAGNDRARARELAQKRIEALDARIADLQRARAPCSASQASAATVAAAPAPSLPASGFNRPG